MKEKIFNKWLVLFILIQPLFDVITSFMTKFGISVTVGIFVKIIILGLMVFYLLIVDKNKRKLNFLCIGLIFIFCIGNLCCNYHKMQASFVSYAGYLMKYIYFLITLLYFIKWNQNGHMIKLNELRIPFVIIALTMFLSWITGSAFDTYLASSGKSGTSGWFFSGNEIGALLSIIFPITLYNAFYNPKSHKWEIVVAIIIGIALLTLGTKVGLLGYFLTIFGYLVYRILTIKNYKFDYRFAICIVALLIPLFMWKNIPAIHNTQMKYEVLDIDNENITKEEKKERMNYLIYSGRNRYVSQMIEKRKNINILEMVFGTFYLRTDNTILITEQDLYDIYFLFGIFGFLMFIVPFIYLLFNCLKNCFKKIKVKIFDIKLILCLLSLILGIGVSIMSGHTILAPSVSTFLLIIFINFYARCFEKKENTKENLLIGSVHLEIGGIERTLISLLKNINYKKYNVDLMLLKPSGAFFDEIPQEVNVITPYNSKLMKKIVSTNNFICKIIKHLCFNYITGKIFSTNKNYKTAISYSGYYSFVDMYVGSSNASKKIIWVHTDVKYLYDHDLKYQKKFNRVKNKYNKFNLVVGVSEGVKESFESIMPKYKGKVTYMWNLLNFDDPNKTINLKLSGKCKIIAVGRLCTQKRFDKIIKALTLVKEDVIVYIVGDGVLKEQLVDLAHKEKVDNKIEFLGALDNVTSVIKQADLFLSTSDFEGLPTVLMEALLCNVPIVATDVCGNNDIYKYIAPKGSMILCKNDITSISKAITMACHGKTSKNFKFDVKKYNQNILKKFYKLIGD